MISQIRKGAQLLDAAVVERDAGKMREEQLREDLMHAREHMRELVEQVQCKIKTQVDRAKSEKDEVIGKLMKEIEICFYLICL